MEESRSLRNKRIAKNTLMLYVRTFVTMLVSLYTSRVILNALGIDNYGIYNVVGGIVGLFSLISGSLVNAISRFLTFTLGTGDKEKLKKVFSTSLIIQLGLSFILLIVAETAGQWFLNHELNIPTDRLYAARWVFQLSILSAILGLLVIPYNACIISHEKMGIYAYLSIIEVSIKLLLIYALYAIPGDKLINYAVMIFSLALIMQTINIVYCKRHFEECRFRFSTDKALIKEMSTFAGWNFFGNAANVCNSQGINILLNLFFGVTVNAARAIVAQVENTIRNFVTNFTTAITPQITKSYSQGDIKYVKTLMDMSSRYSFYLFLLPALPIWMEASYILRLWLGIVPQDTTIFLRLSMIISAITLIGDSSYQVMLATGRIKKFQIIGAFSGLSVLPFAYLCFKLGAPAYSCYILLVLNYIFIVYSRILLLRPFIGPSRSWFLHNTILPALKVLIISSIAPYMISQIMPESISRLAITIILSITTTSLSILFAGMKPAERASILTFALQKIRFRNC